MDSIEAKATMICGIFFIETHLRSGAPKKRSQGLGGGSKPSLIVPRSVFVFVFFTFVPSLMKIKQTLPSPPLPNPRGVR